MSECFLVPAHWIKRAVKRIVSLFWVWFRMVISCIKSECGDVSSVRSTECPGHQKKLMLAVDRLRKSVSSSAGRLRRQSSTITSTPLPAQVIPAVEPRTSSLVRRPSNARSDGPATPTRRAQQPPCLLYTSPSPRDRTRSRMPSSA